MNKSEEIEKMKAKLHKLKEIQNRMLELADKLVNGKIEFDESSDTHHITRVLFDLELELIDKEIESIR